MRSAPSTASETMSSAGRIARAAAAAARNVLLGGNLASLRLLGRPSELVAYASEALFQLRTQTNGRGIPQRSIAEALGTSEPVGITLAELDSRSWMGPVASYATDIVGLCLLCRILRPARIFEIGTHTGYTAMHLALNSPEDAEVLTLDLPPDAPPPSLPTTLMDDWHVRGSREAAAEPCFVGTPAERKITRLFGDSATFDFSPWLDAIDLFFIDGAHSYEYVKSDTRKALACCREGGTIVWHDFGRVGVNGVTRLLRQLSQQGLPVQAVPGGSLAFALLDRPVKAGASGAK